MIQYSYHGCASKTRFDYLFIINNLLLLTIIFLCAQILLYVFCYISFFKSDITFKLDTCQILMHSSKLLERNCSGDKTDKPQFYIETFQLQSCSICNCFCFLLVQPVTVFVFFLFNL